MGSATAKGFFNRFNHALRLDKLSPGVRRVVVGIVGGVVLLVGVAMIVLPGPAIVMIPLGLMILASEFAWAQHYLRKARKLVKRKKK